MLGTLGVLFVVPTSTMLGPAFQEKGEDSKFDLIVRTENPLQSHNRDDIRGIFREALQIAGYTGHILFQDGSRFVEIAPVPDGKDPHSHHGIEA